MASDGGLANGSERHADGRRSSARTIAARLFLSLAAPGLLGGCAIARDILYQPLTQSAVPPQWIHGAPAGIAVTTSDERTVHGLYWAGTPGDPDIFVFFHGRHMNAETGAKFAQHLLGQGDSVLVASYRGFGGNAGRPTERRMMRDATAFVDKARALAGPDARIWLVGHSLGAAVALQATAKNNAQVNAIQGVFAISAFTRASAAAPRILRAFVPDKWDNIAALAHVRVPVVFFQGGLDKYIPADSGTSLTAAAPAALLLFAPHALHNPDMAVLGPWITAATKDLASGGLDDLPAPPAGWAAQVAQP